MATLATFEHNGVDHALLQLGDDQADVEPYLGQAVDGQPIAYLRVGHCAISGSSSSMLRALAAGLAELADRLDGHVSWGMAGSLTGFEAQRAARREAGR